MFEHECSILHLVKEVKKRSNHRQQGHYAWSCCALPSAPTNKSLLLKSAKPTCKILSCLGLSPLPQTNRSIQIRKTYSQNLSWLGQSNIEHRQIWYKCTWFKDSFYLACLFDIFSWCMRCSLRGIVKQQRIGCFLFSFKHLKSLPRFWLCRCLLITRQQRSGRSFDKKYKVWPLAATHLSE